MSYGAQWVVSAAVLLTCGCEHSLKYETPPPGSYEARAYQVASGEATTSADGAEISPAFFDAARIRPIIGRFFVEEDHASSAARTVVLSHDFWKQRFASDPGIIGRTIEIDGRPRTVVGIAPPGFRFPGKSQLWIPRPPS